MARMSLGFRLQASALFLTVGSNRTVNSDDHGALVHISAMTPGLRDIPCADTR